MKTYNLFLLIVTVLTISACATNNNVEMIDESSEGLLSYIDFSNIDQNSDGFDMEKFELDKSECSISASTADTDGNDLVNIGAGAVGAAAGAAIGAASASTAAAQAAAGPIALISIPITYGIMKLRTRKEAASDKGKILAACLIERGYEVGIKQK